MAYKNLRQFIAMLEEKGDLVRVSQPISPVLEMTEIQTRILADKGPAVLFENVIRENGDKYASPVLINLFGTVERVAQGLGCTKDTLRALGGNTSVFTTTRTSGWLERGYRHAPNIENGIIHEAQNNPKCAKPRASNNWR